MRFLVDSGASHNFLPSSFVAERSFREERGAQVRVRLANGSLLRTDRFVFVWVNFGEVSSYLKFTVLSCECPLILGMPFLRRLNPLINWQTRTLSFSSAMHSRNTNTNSFALLDGVLQPFNLGLAGNHSVREPGVDSIAAP